MIKNILVDKNDKLLNTINSYCLSCSLLIQQLRPKLPVFAISAINRDYAFDFQKEDAHVEEFIVKPIDIKNLLNLINNYLK